MKAPAVALAAAFSCGIALGQSHFVGTHAAQRVFLASLVAGALAAIILAIALSRGDSVWPSATCSLLSWIALGTLASSLTQQPLPPEHILARISAQQVPLRTPLRWTGVLQSEPAHIPWGYGLDVNLTQVELAAGTLPVTGGMRLNYTPHPDEPPLPELHAGDQITVLTEAHQPQVFKDQGAFDRRDFLARQNIFLLATLRSSKLLEKAGSPSASAHHALSPRLWIAHASGYLRARLETIFATKPEAVAILTAMLLGDRAFLDRSESLDYQKTGTFHVLAVAGLHVGALTVFLLWLSRKFHLPRTAEVLLILVVLLSYVMLVEQRAPVLRAGLTTAIALLASLFYRRLDLLNSAGLTALILLVANPNYFTDSGFLLSFVAIACIAGIAAPLIEMHLEPFRRALRDWRDITRDAVHAPRLVQFRLDFRDLMRVLASPFRGSLARWTGDAGAATTRAFLTVEELLLVSCVLQFGMLAQMARDFHRVSLLGPLANLFAVPLTGIIVPLGFLTLAASTIFAALPRLLSIPLTWLVIAQHRIVSFFAAIPHATYRIPGPPLWLTIAFFAGLLATVIILRRENATPRWQSATLIFFLLLVSVTIATYPFPPALNARQLEVDVLDVGQGDAIFVVSPKGSTLLIDGGGAFLGFKGSEQHQGSDPGEEAVSAYLWSRGFQHLDAVALTHAHQDHIGGLTAVLENFRVGRLWLGRDTTAPAFLRLKQAANRLHVPIEQERRGQHFERDGVQVEFLWPENSNAEIASAAKNNDSLVVRLRYGDRTILLPGDAEKQVEYTMLAENDTAFLHADVLKVGHHGSKNSTVPQFLAAVNPSISVISAGEENPYGHPHPNCSIV